MDKAEEIAGIFLPAKVNGIDKKKSLCKREEGGGNKDPHEVKLNYS